MRSAKESLLLASFLARVVSSFVCEVKICCLSLADAVRRKYVRIILEDIILPNMIDGFFWMIVSVSCLRGVTYWWWWTAVFWGENIVWSYKWLFWWGGISVLFVVYKPLISHPEYSYEHSINVWFFLSIFRSVAYGRFGLCFNHQQVRFM